MPSAMGSGDSKMAQFDVYENPDPQTSKEVPYLVDVQHELLDELATRVVIPLLTRAAMPHPAQTLNPEFEIEGRVVVLSTAELAGVLSLIHI